MLRIKEDKAVFAFTLDELWWLHEHLPREDGVTREIYEAIKQLEECMPDLAGPGKYVELKEETRC